MIRRLLSIFTILLISATSILAQQKAEAIKAEIKKAEIKEVIGNTGLQSGERLAYSVKWNDLAAAKVVMLTEEFNDKQDKGYRVEIKVDTIGMVKDIVQVRDRFIAFIDPSTRLPFRAEREILEGPKNEQEITTFDQDKHLAKIADNKAIDIAPQTHDVASLLWAIRSIDLKNGSTKKLQALNTGERKMFATIVDVGQREEITTSGGTFQAVQLTIKLQDQKQPSDKYSIRMWVTDDARRIPVLITAQPPFGKVRMELTDSTSTSEQSTSNSETKSESQ
jgi:hypothetical protein